MKEKMIMIASFIVLYLLQFIMFPALFDNYFPRTNECFLLLYVSIVLHCVVGHFMLEKKLTSWMIGMVIYSLLVVIYHGRGLYGIGSVGVSLDGTYPRYDFGFALIISGIIFFLFNYISE